MNTPSITQAVVNEAFGVSMPEVLTKLLQFSYENYEQDYERESAFMGEANFDWTDAPSKLLGVERSSPEVRSIALPAEFIPFGATGSGSFLGVMAFAPERDDAGAPFCYATEEGTIYYVAEDFTKGMELWIGDYLARQDSASNSRARKIDTLLGIKPKPQRITLELFCEPNIPQGWHFESLDNGSGVLAPSTLFDKTYTPAADSSIQASIKAAQELRDKDYPATALLILKQIQAEHWFDIGSSAHELCTAMAALYQDLERPLHQKNILLSLASN